jgi:flagellar hook assembly protein FlgD
MAPPAEGMLGLSPASFTPDGDGRDDLVAISVRVPDARAVRLSVFDVNGRLVRRLIDGETVNEKRITFWDGARDDGSRAPTGMYIVGLEAGEAAGRGGLRAKAAVVLTGR